MFPSFFSVEIFFHTNAKIFPSLPLPLPSIPPTLFIDDRVTASRSRRLRVLLTGRHGNLATSLQWPKVDGLRAGAPEQTEEKSVHARTRNWTCTFVRLTHARFHRSLFLSFFLSFTQFSPAFFSPDRVAIHPAYVFMVFVVLHPARLQTTGREAVVSR